MCCNKSSFDNLLPDVFFFGDMMFAFCRFVSVLFCRLTARWVKPVVGVAACRSLLCKVN